MRFSIIIPLFNAEKHISRCIDSILSQTFKDLELIIVDDCSSDNSISIVESYLSKDSRIKLIKNKENMGTMCTRQVGVENTIGKYITFCDNDDYLPNNALELYYNKICIEDYDVIYGGYIRENCMGKKGSLVKSNVDIKASLADRYKAILSRDYPIATWRAIYLRDIFVNNEYETYKNMYMGEDFLLIIQILPFMEKIGVIDKALYYYCEKTNPITYKRLSNKGLATRVTFLNIQYQILSKKIELTNLSIKFTVEIIFSLLKQNGNLNIILKHLKIPNIEKYLKYKYINKHYTGWRKYYNYLITNSTLFRFFVLKNPLYHLLINYLGHKNWIKDTRI